ncbi:PHP domain-containing protein [Amnibacterium setariae]|uniref:PHP domain-containing protein n=1 Tax=Amnibacterium setariae TaxID=2306585 RepID=A0A3A1U6H8_9MICO|nr:PHP domain-containing protein [Amnibacterium setariae]RIX31057.1 PHP domain-containing protein [Amnibacterium setariae]
MRLPADTHVHSEWSWDTGGPVPENAGRMAAMCERAVRIGLPAIAFTEHLDFNGRVRFHPDDLLPQQRKYLDASGHLVVPPLDVAGYLESIDRCRHRFPELRILTGVEFGQPHLFDAEARALLDLDGLDRVNGSLHTLADGDERAEPGTLYRSWAPDDVVIAYLLEVPRMVAGSDSFAVVTHLDYAARAWPVGTAGPFEATRFEEPFRVALRAIAGSGRALEMNTRRLEPWLPRWWAEEGGRAISFGSDAHDAHEGIAGGFPEAVAMVEQVGFRAGRRAEDLWTR